VARACIEDAATTGSWGGQLSGFGAPARIETAYLFDGSIDQLAAKNLLAQVSRDRHSLAAGRQNQCNHLIRIGLGCQSWAVAGLT